MLEGAKAWGGGRGGRQGKYRPVFTQSQSTCISCNCVGHDSGKYCTVSGRDGGRLGGRGWGGGGADEENGERVGE